MIIVLSILGRKKVIKMSTGKSFYLKSTKRLRCKIANFSLNRVELIRQTQLMGRLLNLMRIKLGHLSHQVLEYHQVKVLHQGASQITIKKTQYQRTHHWTDLLCRVTSTPM